MASASLPSGPDGKKRRVLYFYDPSIGDYSYSDAHPLKPFRIKMTHQLILNYSLHHQLKIIRAYRASPIEFKSFHSDEYIDFLASVRPYHRHDERHIRFNLGRDDCPVFDGLFKFCQASAGSSISSAWMLNRQRADIVLNWAGGMHHAAESRASGFNYVNDVVLGILELLKQQKRVLYVDIDVTDGGGVEEAFFDTDRVMTVSFHKFGGGCFPEKANITDIGLGSGKYYALNIPLHDGIDDKSYQGLFQPIIQKVMEVYDPDAVVLQSGAASLSGDKFGCFNLSVKGHAECLRFLRSFNVPLMVLGGEGYTLSNVARCWCYETAVAVGVEPENKLPYHAYYCYYAPDYTLHFEPPNMQNQNSPEYLEKIRNLTLEQLSRIQHIPSVQFQARPPDTEAREKEEEEIDQRPKRRRQTLWFQP